MSTMSEQTEDTTVGQRHRAIEDKVLLLSPTVGKWEGRLKIPTEHITMTIGGKAVDTSKRGVTTPHTVMLTDAWPVDKFGVPWKKRINKVLARKDQIIRTYSVPFAMAGARIVPKHKGVEFFSALIGKTLGKLRRELQIAKDDYNDHGIETLALLVDGVLEETPGATDSTPVYDHAKEANDQSFAYQWLRVSQEFADDLLDSDQYSRVFTRGDYYYPPDLDPDTGEEMTDGAGIPICQKIMRSEGVLTQIQKALDRTAPGVWDLVKDRVPSTPAAMKSKFYSTVYPVELASGGQFSGVTAELLDDYKDVVDQAMKDAVDGCIAQVVEKPREELCTAIANLQELINRNGQVSQKSFRPVYAAIEKLKLFSFACTDDMLEQIEALSARMDITQPRELNSQSAVNNGFSGVLTAIVTEAGNAAQQAQDVEEFGKEARGLVL